MKEVTYFDTKCTRWLGIINLCTRNAGHSLHLVFSVQFSVANPQTTPYVNTLLI